MEEQVSIDVFLLSFSTSASFSMQLPDASEPTKRGEIDIRGASLVVSVVYASRCSTLLASTNQMSSEYSLDVVRREIGRAHV